MLLWRTVIVGLFYCCIKTGVTQCRTKDVSIVVFNIQLHRAANMADLFPAASKIKRGVVKPTFHNSLDDVNLLFEILLAGAHFKASGELSVQDAELASLGQTRNLALICKEIIPRKISDIFRLISALSNHIGHLHEDDFEHILLTLVYTAQQVVNSTTKYQQDVWSESFVSLYKAIKQDLIGTN